MRAFRMTGLLAGLILLVAAAAASAETFAGVYEVRQDNKLMGAERFEIEFASDGSYISKGDETIRLQEGGESSATGHSELRVASTGTLKDYQREVYINQLPRKIVATFDGINFLCQFNAGKGPVDRKIKAPMDALVVDVGIYNHLTLLVRRAVKGGLLGKPIPYVVPSEFNQGTAWVEDRGEDSVKMTNGFFHARRYFIDMGTYGASVWTESTGRVIKVLVPMTGFSAELQKYDGKRAESAQPLKMSSRQVDHLEIVFDSVSTLKGLAETKLRGVLRRPKGVEGKLPTVVFLSDTGPQDADGKENVTGVKTLTGDLGDALAEMGIAFFSWDDRGVGGSGGDIAQATLDVLAKDGSAALNMLKDRDDVDSNRLYVMGLGEGANVAVRLAGSRQDVKGVVAIAPSPVSFAKLAEEQARRRLKADGVMDENALKTDPVMVAIRKSREDSKEFMVLAGRPVYLDLYRQWDRLDPVADLKSCKAPVLHVAGEKDMQVPAESAAPLAEAGKSVKGYSFKSFDKLDHFLARGRGTFGSYSDPDRTVDPEAAAFIGRWLNALKP